MKTIQKGFTLIELMIVVAIIGILAAVAIPAYQDYIVKAKLSKVVSTLDPVKTALALYFQERGGFPLADPADAIGFGANQPGQQPNLGSFWNSLGFSVFPSLPAEVARMAVHNVGVGTSIPNIALILTLDNVKAGTINGAYVSVSPNIMGNLGPIGTANNVVPTSATTTSLTAAESVSGASALDWFYGCAMAGEAGFGFNSPNGPDPVLKNFFKNANQPIICR